MNYEVRIKRKIERGLGKLPSDVKKLFFLLVADLQVEGPIQKSWQNFSPLGDDRYHCHLNYRYVACWTCRKNEIAIEVYYVGSREKAPY
jgi:mRNA-degrading endonuclease RelE of RelBE toxin-antitoxin system